VVDGASAVMAGPCTKDGLLWFWVSRRGLVILTVLTVLTAGSLWDAGAHHDCPCVLVCSPDASHDCLLC
jgi:hypothetical protein